MAKARSDTAIIMLATKCMSVIDWCARKKKCGSVATTSTAKAPARAENARLMIA